MPAEAAASELQPLLYDTDVARYGKLQALLPIENEVPRPRKRMLPLSNPFDVQL